MRVVSQVATAAALLLVAASAAGQYGMHAPAESPWPRWQARIERLGDAPSAAGLMDAGAGRPQGAQLFGDYYLLDLQSPTYGLAGGIRATSGLTIGTRGLITGMPPGVGASGLAWRSAAAALHNDGSEAGTESLPYIGLGLTGLSTRGGWGLSADIGLAGYGSGAGLRLGAAADGSNVDEVLRELRLTPVLQLGVSYSF